MRRNPEKTVRRRGGVRAARWVLVGVFAVCFTGCESASHSNLSEYEKLVARRRTQTQARVQPPQFGETTVQSGSPSKAPPTAVPSKMVSAKPSAPVAKSASRSAVPAKSATPAKPAAQQKPTAPSKPVIAQPVEVVPPPPPVELVSPPASPVADPNISDAAQPTALAARNAAVAGVYRLAKGDIVQIALRGIPEGALIDDSLDEDGMISLPFIHEVRAEGLTASELEQRIRQIYRDSQIYPNVTVQVQVPTRYYYMQGEIRGPGKVQLVSATRLSQAIAAAGGGTEFWNGKVLLRRNGEIFRRIKNAKRLEKYPEDDILLEPGDIVELQRSWL